VYRSAMTRTTFFDRQGPISVGELAERTGAEVARGADASRLIGDVAPVTDCGPDEVTLIADRRRLAHADGLKAGACILAPEFACRLPEATAALVTPSAQAAFALAIAAFYPGAVRDGPRTAVAGTPAIDPTARLEDGVEIEAGAVVGAEAEIGSGTLICANAVIGRRVRIGRSCVVGPGASVIHALIGDNVIIHPGARIGQDGFGYAQRAGGLVKLPQIGRVIIQNDVEIGANATIDRGAFEDTVVGEGTKIDNLVQVGHNVKIGRYCILVSQSGISGSVRMGDGVLVGGQVGIKPHVEIGPGAQLGAQAGIVGNVAAGTRVWGTPQRPIDEFMHELRVMRRLSRKARKAQRSEN